MIAWSVVRWTEPLCTPSVPCTTMNVKSETCGSDLFLPSTRKRSTHTRASTCNLIYSSMVDSTLCRFNWTNFQVEGNTARPRLTVFRSKMHMSSAELTCICSGRDVDAETFEACQRHRRHDWYWCNADPGQAHGASKCL